MERARGGSLLSPAGSEGRLVRALLKELEGKRAL
jgi:hypothetical protein